MDLKRLSYFTDFILIQQLMTIEVDILIGRTNNYIKYLDLDWQRNGIGGNNPAKHDPIGLCINCIKEGSLEPKKCCTNATNFRID